MSIEGMENLELQELTTSLMSQGPGMETQISNRLLSACTSLSGGRKVTVYLNLGVRLGNLRPVTLTPLWFQHGHFQRPLSF